MKKITLEERTLGMGYVFVDNRYKLGKTMDIDRYTVLAFEKVGFYKKVLRELRREYKEIKRRDVKGIEKYLKSKTFENIEKREQAYSQRLRNLDKGSYEYHLLKNRLEIG